MSFVWPWLSLTYSGKFINRPYKKIRLKLDAFSVHVLHYKYCTYSVYKPPQENPFLDKTNLRRLRVGTEPVENKHKTAMRRRCEVRCRHVTPYKLQRHKFVVFRKYFGRNSADYCRTESPCESPVKAFLETKSLLARCFFGWRQFDLVLTLLSIYLRQQGENVFASDFCEPNKKVVKMHDVFCSLRILFWCQHEHPGKLFYCYLSCLSTQIQFWLRNVCSFRHRITNKNWSLWRPSDMILALKKTCRKRRWQLLLLCCIVSLYISCTACDLTNLHARYGIFAKTWTPCLAWYVG